LFRPSLVPNLCFGTTGMTRRLRKTHIQLAAIWAQGVGCVHFAENDFSTHVLAFHESHGL
jgi:hypothetical protein